ncbi:MAG: hypothetical protein IJX57_03315, partial [Clostridia bacterium]|nr:hypothetical protein [Clostridia bacterium]
MLLKKFVNIAVAVSFSVSCLIVPHHAKAEELMNVKFAFGSENTLDGIAVTADCAYGEQENGLTYGFVDIDEASVMNDIRFDGFSDDVLTYIKDVQINDINCVTADYSKYDTETLNTFGDGVIPVRFAVSVEPHKYYTVSATVVNTSETESAEVSLFSENRYVILYNHILAPGETLTKTWNVNLEGQYYNSTGAYTNDAINVAVAGKNTGLADVTIKQHEKMGKTIWLCTDSTGDNSSASIPYFGLRGKCGVGQVFPKYFNPEIAVNNQGEGGLTSSDTNHLNNALKYMQEGDYLYVQYGFNGETTESLVKNLPRYYNAVKEKGGKLIVASTTERQNSSFWNSDTSKWEASNAAIAKAGKKYVEDMIAQGADDIAFIDLNTAFSNWMNTESENIMVKRQALGFSDTKPTRLAMNYYFGYDRDSGVDSVHINDAGADNAAYLVMQEIKNTVGVQLIESDKEIVKITASYDDNGALEDVEIEEIMSSEATEADDTANTRTFYWESLESMKPYDVSSSVKINDTVQAKVLYELMQNSPDEKPYTMPDELLKKGWVPNDSYPYPLPGNVEYEYPTIVKSVNIENDSVSDIKVMVQGNMQYYAQGVVDILDADGNVVKTVYSTSTDINPLIDHIDNTACSYGEIYTMYFDKEDTVLID